MLYILQIQIQGRYSMLQKFLDFDIEGKVFSLFWNVDKINE